MDRSLLIITPDAQQHEEAILRNIKSHGFHISNRRRVQLTQDQAIDLFQEYLEDEEFKSFQSHITSQPILGLLISKLNGLAEIRELLGPNDPIQAKKTHPSSLRAIYGTNSIKNGIYLSDSVTSEREIVFFFPDSYVDTVPTIEHSKEFLEAALYPTLRKGLTELCKVKPSNPTAWLGNWMLENNPNTPKIEEPIS